jgi:hypothetical protein
MEDYKSKFTQVDFKEELANYFPLIHSIMQETNKINLEQYVGEELEGKENEISLNGKAVDRSSLEIDGVHRWDHPDYADAYFSYGEYTDGTPLGDEELEALTSEYGDILNQMAHDSMHESNDPMQQFEQWAEAVEQGKLAPDQIQALAEKLRQMEESGQPLEFGPEGTTAIAFFAEYGINYENLPETQIDALEEKLRQDAKDAAFDETASPVNTLKIWAKEHQPDLVAELGLEEPAPEEPPAEPAPAPEEPPAEPAPEQPVAEGKDNKWIHEVAKLVKSRYNATNESVGPFNGVENIALDVKKEISEKFGEDLGEKAEMVAKQFMEKLTREWEERHGKSANLSVDQDDGLARLKELLGNVKQKVESIDPKNPRDYERPAVDRKAAGEPPLTLRDIDDKDNASPTTAAGLAKSKAELGIDENVDDILKLSGLAK